MLVDYREAAYRIACDWARSHHIRASKAIQPDRHDLGLDKWMRYIVNAEIITRAALTIRKVTP